MAKKVDLRILRTKKMIFAAFMQLVEEEGFDAVTIQEIADKAMINRTTFYAHFKDKQDLYDQIFTTSMVPFLKILDGETISGNQIKLKTVTSLLTRLFTEIKANRQFYMLALDGANAMRLSELLHDLLAQHYVEIFDHLLITHNQKKIPTDFIISYMTSIFIGTVNWWVRADSDFSPEHMAKLVIQLVANGHLTVLGIEVLDD
ncbi:TetR/AcrR family transcriptional regulator [Loigolactobacillus coryniformis]|jgi:AcrR family transcriptional regulator|uniref:TetR family transcriptional regulator n=1 Tax=Loigolactobacillus coryniformis subsp. torquens DSM 20004 = KCTC 3535 TaxID=1423822 RepID=A0A2D1KR21_9LACO|nr:TetR/AcrR family transcriptional regulator [Loigolactobacillus coryniformis]ATO44541.1 TetR family transcriptional regulator [Loigolactobacillus coryniformis subsp. torquens DSM 20004 = KCTC 3535]KRK84997.1 TetR family transcriptional regulator [Loigolactobacillus coryniformis subsp. torquens DSM 20004 = KCTC 3535]MBW4803283.1 TetR/AcrR family transcriptional regulator [Loigolactobacillus coryniformis subsp. torquens]MBW4805979.1 TetR/AcrR family transcriptional regulator [Loigolactobacillus